MITTTTNWLNSENQTEIRMETVVTAVYDRISRSISLRRNVNESDGTMDTFDRRERHG